MINKQRMKKAVSRPSAQRNVDKGPTGSPDQYDGRANTGSDSPEMNGPYVSPNGVIIDTNVG